MKKPTGMFGRELVRDVESGVPAPLRASDLKHAVKSIDGLVAGEAPDATVHVPVATLRLYREAVRLELTEELEGRAASAERRLGREEVFDGLVEDAERVYPKGTRVLVFDPAGYGVRPNGERVGDGSLWVPGVVEFVCGRKTGGRAGHVSVYCDDGRGRRGAGPHEVVLESVLLSGQRVARSA